MAMTRFAFSYPVGYITIPFNSLLPIISDFLSLLLSLRHKVVNDISVLASSGRIASCDGTVHIWNGQTGKQISVFSESSLTPTRLTERDEDNMLHFNPLPSGMLGTAFHWNSYTAMDYLEFNDRLIVGTGNGSLR